MSEPKNKDEIDPQIPSLSHPHRRPAQSFYYSADEDSRQRKLPIGKVKIEIETSYLIPRPGGPLKVALKVDGKVVAEGTAPISAPLLFAANDCLGIGIALGSPVSLDYSDKAPFKFNGKIEPVHVKYVTPK